LIAQAIELFQGFSRELQTENDVQINHLMSETELIGKLLGYLSVADPSINVGSHVPLAIGRNRVQIDLLLEKGGEKILVEVNRQTTEFMRRVRQGIEQVYAYLSVTQLTNGILFCPPILKKGEITVKRHTREVGSQTLVVVAIYPKLDR